MDGTGTRSTRTRARRVDIRRLPVERLLVIGAERAGRRRAGMHCLVTVDVTAARGLIAYSPEPLSFAAFIAASVARVAAEYPDVHAYRDWRGRLVTHRHVDVMIPIEVQTPRGLAARPHLVHDADLRQVADISAELLAAKRHDPDSRIGGTISRFSWALRVPGLVRGMYLVLDRSVRARQRMGTVTVTTVGISGAGGGFGIAPPTLMPLQVVIGGISRRPHSSGNLIDRHEVLDLTVTFDHNVVDGAPAARFVARLCEAIEMAEVLLAAEPHKT